MNITDFNMDFFSLKGKNAIVTGGNSGLGQAFSVALAKGGANVLAVRIMDDDGETKKWVEACDVEYRYVYGDITADGECKRIVETCVETWGSIDILVNCAGITRDGTMKKMSYEQWYQVIDTNLNSVFNTCRSVIEMMLENGYGRIINISSINGRKGQFGQVNYAAAKAGMHGLTMSLAQETATKGITVNTVSPGYIATDMIMKIPEQVREAIRETIPVKRYGTPEEIGRLVTFLADKESGFITGANIDINGGQFMG